MIRSLRYILSQVRVAHLGIVATVLFVLCVVQCVRCSELAGGHDSPSNGSIRVLAHIADPDAPCPSPITAKGGTWNGKKVFEPAPNEKLPPSMRTLCAYDWTASRAGAPPDHSALSSLGVPVESEFPVLATLAPVTPVTPQQATDLAKATSAFLDQVGKGPWPAGLKQTTTLAFVDSSPRSLGQISLGKNPHGFNVGWIAQSIACPNTAAGAGAPWCASRPNMHLALRHPTPPTPNSTPDPDGGSYGTRSQLAAAIFEAVKDARSTSPRSGLIVNLSVGWEPQFDCVDAPRDAASTSNDEKKAATQKKGTSPIVEGPATHQTARPESGRFSPPPPRSHCRKGQISRDPLGLASVHEALLYAACHGAIVVAAAGNDMGYTPPLEGAMMPARWENSPRPTFDECDRWFGKKLEEGDAKATYRPLVYAVSGLTATNAMIPLSRTHARTRLFAPASLGVGFREGVDLSATTTNPWHLMTGTSVGAAVVSAVAATAWAYRDDLTGP